MNRNSLIDPLRLPVIVSFSGHRDILDTEIPHIHESIKRIFIDLAQKYPNTNFILCSGMASGSDQEAVLAMYHLKKEKKEIAKRLRILGLLPMPKEHYYKDFKTIKEKKTFEKTLELADEIFEMPMLESERDEQYMEQTRYLVRRSQILIAAWNGREGLKGGTGDSVHQFEDKYSESRTVIQIAEGDSNSTIVLNRVLHIPCKRIQDQTLPDEGKPITHASNLGNQSLHESIKLIDSANQELSTSETLRKIQPEKWTVNLGTSIQKTHLEFKIFDKLANFYQVRRKRHWKIVLWILSLGLLCYELSAFGPISDIFNNLKTYPIFKNSNYFFLLLYPILLGVAYGFFKFVEILNKSDSKTKYLDYRAIAEGLRVQQFWDIAGIKDCVADHYFEQNSAIMRWIQDVIGNLNFSPKKEITPGKENRDLIMNLWIKNQITYMVNSKNREVSHRKKLDNLANFLIVLAIIIAFVPALIGIFEWQANFPIISVWDLPISTFDIIEQISGFYIGAGVMLAGLVMYHRDKLELDEEIRLKQLSLDIFLDAKRRMTHALEMKKNLNEWEKMVSNLGEAVLTEHSEWYKMHRSHPASIPWGG